MSKIILPLILILHLLILSQLTFTAWPEMFSYSYLIKNGFIPYKDFIMPYPPSLVLFLGSVFNFFGFNPEVLKILTWFLIIIVDLGVFYLLKRATQNLSAALVFLFFFILLQAFLDGNMLWFDFASEIALLPGFIWILKWQDGGKTKDLLIATIFLSIAVTIKQVAFLYLGALILVYLLKKRFLLKDVSVIFLGAAVIIIPLFIYLLQLQAVTEFWQWILLYPLTEWPKFPGYVQMSLNLKQALFLFVLLLPVSGLFLNLPKFLSDKIIRSSLIFLIAALIAIFPRFSYFHLQPALPFLIILAARIYTLISVKQKFFYGTLMGSVVMSFLLFVGREAFGQGIRFYEEKDRKIAEKVSVEVKVGEKVFLQGINSAVYVYAQRLPPKHWSDNFGWYLEILGVSEWVVDGFEENPPEKIFWRIPTPGKWYDLGTYQPPKIIEYIHQYYQPTGKIEGGVEIWSKKS